MGFNNGYDSGYADALEDVRSGRVAGLGPASESGGGETAPVTRAAGMFYLTGGDQEHDFEFIPPFVLSHFPSVLTELTATFTDSDGYALAHVEAPGGEWVPGDTIVFQHNSFSFAGVDRGDAVVDDESVSNFTWTMVDLMLMRLVNKWILVPSGYTE